MQRQVGIRRHESERGAWEIVDALPDPSLAGAVVRYAGFLERSPGPVRRREVAQGAVTVILDFGPGVRVGGAAEPLADRGSFVAAMHDAYAITEYDGTSHGLQVDFTPLGAHRFLGLPMRELSTLVVPLEDVLGAAAPRLVERLADAPGWAARFDILDHVIARRITAARAPRPDVVRAWRRLAETDGRIPVQALAGELGCSRRHLATHFREHVGPAPKTAARILRFERAVRLLGRDDGGRLAEIAQDCGFYDQAHLNRDFRELAGTTPGDFVASRLPDGFGVTA